MAFSQAVKDAAYRRAGGRCECTMNNCRTHRAGVRCNAQLTRWHAHHKHSVVAGGSDDLSNYLAMCVPCHENTRTYGRS
jgi:HNH endonuclease